MRSLTMRFRQRRPILAFTGGVVLLGISTFLLVRFALASDQARQHAITVGLSLPNLRTRVSLLSASIQTEQLYLRESQAARDEQAAAYVLPVELFTPRVVNAMHGTVAALRRTRELELTSLTFAPVPIIVGDARQWTATVTLAGSLDSVAQFVSVLEWGSNLTVRDVLAPSVASELIMQVEQQHPASLTRALQFLSLDLLKYAADSDASENQLIRDMPETLARDVRYALLQADSGLPEVRSILSPVAADLKQRKIWPMELAKVTTLSEKNGQWTVTLGVMSR